MISRNEIKTRARAAFMRNYWPCVGVFAALSAVTGMAGGFGGFGSGFIGYFLRIGKDAIPAPVILIFTVISFIISFFSTLVAIFVTGPLTVSGARAGLNIYDGAKPHFKDLIFCFREGRYWKSVGSMALGTLFTSLAAMVMAIPTVIIMVILGIVLNSPDAALSDGAKTAIMIAAGLGTTLLSIIPSLIVGFGLSQIPYVVADEGLSGMAAVRRSWEIMRGHKGEYFALGLSFLGWSILTAFTYGILGVFYTGPYMSLSYAGYYRELTRAKPDFEEGSVTVG